MDFVSKALGSLTLGLPFTLGESISLVSPQPWKLYDATLKKDGSNISVFEYDEHLEAAAQNATTALRKLKIPGVVKHIDTVTSGKRSYVITERVQPFNFDSMSLDAKKYVAQTVLKSLETLYTVAQCKHNSVCSSTVLQSASSGQPLLVGFDLATINDLPVPPYASMFNTIPIPANDGWRSPTLDVYQFGMLVADILPQETRLIGTLKADKRPSIVKLASSNSAELVFRNPISELVSEIGQAVLLAPHELTKLCEQLEQILPELYPGLITGTFLPELLRTKNPLILHTVLVLVSSLNPADTTIEVKQFTKDDEITQYIVEQFQSMDRVVRLELLRFLPRYIALIPDVSVQQNIMPKMVFGFGDNEVIVRKASVAAVECLADKLTTRQRNSDLLRLLAKSHNDADPNVRALTTTVLCRLAPKLESRSVISTALGRALKDPVPLCRDAALKGVSQIDVPPLEIAEKLIGPAATGMLDPDENVSAEAWRVTDELLKKIRKGATSKGPAAPPPSSSSPSSSTSGPPNELQRVLGQTQNSSASIYVAQEKPPTPISTLLATPVDRHQGAADNDNDLIDVEEDAWGWGDADADANDNDNQKTTTSDQTTVESAWDWDSEKPIDEDAWGW